MKMYLISDNVDTYTGMRLAGVEGVVVHERKELKEPWNLRFPIKRQELSFSQKNSAGNFLRSSMKSAFITKRL